MNIRTSTCLFLALALAVPVLATAGGDLTFRSDYPAAAREARKQNKAMIVEFETAWCPFCRAMEKVTFKDPAVVKAASDLILAKVDADTQTVLARKFHVEDAFPLFVFLDRNQEELFRLDGYHPPDSFRLAIEAVADENSPLSKAKERAKANPKDARALLDLGDALYRVGAVGEAAEVYGKTLDRGLEGEEAERAASRRAEHCREVAMYSDAESLYKQLISSHAASERAPFYSLGLIQTYLAWGKDEAAEEILATLVEEYPDHPATKSARAMIE